MSSYYDVPPRPRWLVRVQVVGLIAQFAVFTVLFCQLAFGIWQHQIWLDVAIIVLMLGFAVSQVAVLRWFRSLKKQ